MSPWTFSCPECDAENVSQDDHVFVCGSCGYEHNTAEDANPQPSSDDWGDPE